eukprot:3886170-Prymnesium_polylepis.1
MRGRVSTYGLHNYAPCQGTEQRDGGSIAQPRDEHARDATEHARGLWSGRAPLVEVVHDVGRLTRVLEPQVASNDAHPRVFRRHPQHILVIVGLTASAAGSHAMPGGTRVGAAPSA